MITGNFYYIKDSYYDKFPNCDLIGNKNVDTEGKHDRPCFLLFWKRWAVLDDSDIITDR